MSAKKLRNKSNATKTRKQLRKEERKNKKMRKHEYYTKRRKPGQFVLLKKNSEDKQQDKVEKSIAKQKKETKNVAVEKIMEKEKKQQAKLQKQMTKQRSKHLHEANLEEDRNIRRLEKQLKLHKRKSKSVPASFSRDGLDYLLEVCNPESLESSALAEQQLAEINDEFEEDMLLMTEDSTKDFKKNENLSHISTDEDVDEVDSSDTDVENDDETEDDKIKYEEKETKSRKRVMEDIDEDEPSLQKKKNDDGTWEDIYGRLRAKDGSVIDTKNDKYIPPAARIETEVGSVDKVRSQKLDRLRKQLQGLINRLAESNMHSITTQIEDLYMNNSRNDMNQTITNLIIEALVSNVLTPERLLMEHVVLITILHANVGTEVGAHFLEAIVKLFDNHLNDTNTEDKKLDNITIILAQLYNFKLFDSKLVYEVLDKLSETFREKDVECILHILRNVGFSLRKDNSVALKNFILNLQRKAANASEEMKDNSRVKFMLDILLAIKNNNVSKIPNYDTSYSEHLKKIMKGFIRKGNYVIQLNISVEDLIKADEKGKWWVVGSAWVGTNESVSHQNDLGKSENFSQKLLELATKQRMNTDARKNIFCVIMSAEDYLDAFEKLLKLALKHQQEKEIIHVILHCCLQERVYNPFYAILAQKFCEYDRKYQMTIKYSIWDKLKALKDHSAIQISHLAKLLSYLFIEKGLPISTLKIIQFSDLDKVTLRFIRQILLGILLHENLDICQGVFEKVCQSEKLKMFRESLRLFLHHFLLRNLDSQGVPNEKKELLQQRVKVVEKLLTGRVRH